MKRSTIQRIVLFIIVLVFSTNRILLSQWSTDPNVNTPVSGNSYTQFFPSIIKDGSGGVIIAWKEFISSFSIYVQHLDPNGYPQWSYSGINVCTCENGELTAPGIASDGAGGAILTWIDNYNIYAQRINSSGQKVWSSFPNGVVVCNNASAQSNPAITHDGSGGAIIAWEDSRSGVYNIYAQRINENGEILWKDVYGNPSDVRICPQQTSSQIAPAIIFDEYNVNAVITWGDYRNGNRDIFAQRITTGGLPWSASGIEVCTNSSTQNAPDITIDNAGNAIIVWQDSRTSHYLDLYAQRISPSGSKLWGSDIKVCTISSSDNTPEPAIEGDGKGGAIITWGDQRNSNQDIFAQRINSAGDILWSANGEVICTQTDEQLLPDIAASGDGIFVITWYKKVGVSLDSDIYAQRIFDNGSFSLPSPPDVSILAPTNLTSTSLSLNGTIDPKADIEYYFKYSTNSSMEPFSSTSAKTTSGTSQVNLSESVSGLTANTVYYVQLIASNVGGSATSEQIAVVTDAGIPHTNLKLWLRADKGTSTTTENGSISKWYDVSGNGNDALQDAESAKPKYMSNRFNGYPSIWFNGSSSYLILPTPAEIGIQNTNYEMFIAARSQTDATQFLIAGEFENFEVHLNGTVGCRFIPVTGKYIDIGSFGRYATADPHVFSARTSGGAGVVRVDGTDGSTTAGNMLSAVNSNLQIGRRSDSYYYLNGDILEIIIYNNTHLTPAEKEQVESYLGNKYGVSALPVELISFTAEVNNDKVILRWNTATEVNNYGFTVERLAKSLNKGDWEKIGFVEGAGNSNSSKEYSFSDNLSNISNVSILKYRLKQIDSDGKFNYSDEVSVEMQNIASILPTEFLLEQNYPNPFNPTTTIQYQIPEVNNVSIKVYDLLGNEIDVLVNEVKQPGSHEVQLDGSNYSSGVYFYKLETNTFSETKKFVLMK